MWDLTQNEAANAGIYEELVQSELANTALYRDLVQIESDNAGVYLFLQRPFPEWPHKWMADTDDLLQEYRRMHMLWLEHDQEHFRGTSHYIYIERERG